MDSIAIFVLAEDRESQQEFSRNLRAERRILRNRQNPIYLSNIAFRKNYRLNKKAFAYVLNILEAEISPLGNCFGLTPKEKLCAFLRFVAEGSYQHGVGQDYGIAMAESTVSQCITQVLNILEKKLCPIWINLSMTQEQKQKAKRTFYERSGFPGVIMCVDGTHIKILPPAKDKNLFYNRKGFFSLNAMIICDEDMRIRSVDGRFPGCNHDSHIWNLSDAWTYFEQLYRQGERNNFLLGDAGYPLEPWLMTPFRSPIEGSPQSVFNKKHAKARNVVERAIGLLKNRFRCLLGARQLHMSPKKAIQVLNVCCALHNICIHFNVQEEYPAELEDLEKDAESEANAENSSSNEALHIRNAIMDSL